MSQSTRTPTGGVSASVRVGVKREFGDIGRSRIRYAAASEALALIARVAGEQSGI